MILGPTFDKQLMTPATYIEDVNFYMGGVSGIRRGITYRRSGLNFIIDAGSILACGETVIVENTETVTAQAVLSGVMYCRLVCEIDLTQTNTDETLNQVSFKILSSGSGYPPLVQEDLTNGGTKYQVPICRFQNATSGISNVVDERHILTMGQYATKEALQELSKTVDGKMDGSELNSDYESIIGTGSSDDDAPSTSVIKKLYESFQAGVSSIVKAIKDNGVTPASDLLSDVIAAINSIRSDGSLTDTKYAPQGKTWWAGKEKYVGTGRDLGSSLTYADTANTTVTKEVDGYVSSLAIDYSNSYQAGVADGRADPTMQAIDLGSGQSFDIKSKYPDYTKLTINNFRVDGGGASIGINSSSDGGVGSAGGGLRISYNANTGILSASFYATKSLPYTNNATSYGNVHAYLLLPAAL